MRIKYLLHICYCLAVAGCALWATPTSIHAQQPWLPSDPVSPIAPTEHSQCNDLSRRWSELVSEINRLHDECLAANQKNNAQRIPRSGRGRNSTCDFSSCQSLHTRLHESEYKGDREVEGCRERVETHQENKRQQQEAEEERQREAKEREERERAERKEREAKKREAEADQQKRSDEADRRREREEANEERLRRAAKQQQLEREALERRTEERKQQVEELRKREGEVNDRYGQAVEKQTRDTQDALLAQMQSKAGSETSSFPTTDSSKNDAGEFDLNSSPGRDPAGSLPQLSPQYDDAIAPPRDSYFSTAFQNVRDFVSPIVEKGRALFVEELRDMMQENVNEVRDTLIMGVFNDKEGARAAESMALKYFENGYRDPVRDIVSSAFDASGSGLVNEAAADVSRSVAAYVGLHPESGGIIGALTDVAVKNGAEKLSDYARGTFVDSMSGRFSDAYKNISERILGPTDPITQPVQDTALLRLPGLVSKAGNPAAAAKAIYDYGINMVNAMDEMFDRLIKSEFFGTAPPDSDPNK